MCVCVCVGRGRQKWRWSALSHDGVWQAVENRRNVRGGRNTFVTRLVGENGGEGVDVCACEWVCGCVVGV